MYADQVIQMTDDEIVHMDRGACIHELTHFAPIPLDFTEEFLAPLGVERLRHLLLAAVLASRQKVHAR